MERPIAIIFHRFGPYHCARLRAVAAQVPAVAIEVVRKDTIYQWDVVDDSQGFRRVTLFRELMADQPRVGDLRRRLYRCLASEQPRAVAIPGWESPYALLALSWCLRTSTPAVLMSESTFIDRRRTLLRERIKRKLLCLYKGALVAGRRQTEYLQYLGFPELAVSTSYDVIDNAHFGRMQPGDEVEPGVRQSFLVSCRFVRVKNLQRLLEGYARYRLEAGSASWDLVLAGDGPERDKIVEAMRVLNLGDSVRLAGFVQYDGLPALYARAGALVLPSVSEPWGLVVNEAMAAGLPVLVSKRCGCAPDLVQEGRNGFTFDPYETEQLARLMLRVSSMSEDERSAMGQTSREIISRWTPETFATNLMKAAEVATAAPRPKATVSDKALLWALIHRPRALP
ncbi:MAG: glycosyltransferase [Acidobacteriia bacterium]|nr:glycosyltransferase [Terriglobia bacterium]